MKESSSWKRKAWFWVGVALLSVSGLWWLLIILVDTGDIILVGTITTVIPIGLGIFCIWRGRKRPTVEIQQINETTDSNRHSEEMVEATQSSEQEMTVSMGTSDKVQSALIKDKEEEQPIFTEPKVSRIRKAWFWTGVTLLAIGGIGWMAVYFTSLTDPDMETSGWVWTGVALTIIPILLGVFCVLLGRKTITFTIKWKMIEAVIITIGIFGSLVVYVKTESNVPRGIVIGVILFIFIPIVHTLIARRYK